MITLTCDNCGMVIKKTPNCNEAIASIHDYTVFPPRECKLLCDECKKYDVRLLPCPVCDNPPSIDTSILLGSFEIGCKCDRSHLIMFRNGDFKAVCEQWDKFASGRESK